MIKLFTHNDLDAIGCAIVAFTIFGKDSVHVEYCDYNNINKKVEDFVYNEEHKNYSKVFITDISVNEKVADLINITVDNLKLIDHHKSAKWLNKYDWAYVSEVHQLMNSWIDKNSSGTSLFFEYLTNNNLKLEVFAEMVRLYDTWDWSRENNDKPKKFNDLLRIIGRDRFVDEMVYRITNEDSIFKPFTDFDNKIIALKKEEINRYIDSKNKQLVKYTIQGYTVGVVYAEQYLSELGNRLCEINADIDLIAIINNCNAVSYRTIKDIDLSKFASTYGGGGHRGASAHSIKSDLKDKITQMIFQ